VGDLCDFAGTRAYRLSPTESTRDDAFFAENYAGAGGLVWVRLGTVSRVGHTCDLDTFVKVVLPTIGKPFVLITTDGDASVPSDIRVETVNALTASPYLVRWYSQNCDGTEPEIRPFPIGLDLHTPRAWTSPQQLLRVMKTIRENALPVEERPHRIFCDLGPAQTGERHRLRNALEGCDHVDFLTRRVSQAEIWKTYARYPLVLSTHGNGLDCHRTWELLAIGCIVVTRTSSLDPLYDGLPVVILDDWEEARDRSNIAQWMSKYASLTKAPETFDRLAATAWIKRIREELEASVSTQARL